MAWLEPYHGDMLTSQLELQEDQAFTDLTVRLRDGEVRTCRLTLASMSRVFYRMLATDMRERNEGVLTLEHVSREDWHCILSFYLSGDKLVTADNVEDVLIIAHLYELAALEKHCGRVLVDTLTSENCCDRLALSKKQLPSASEKIFDYIKKNFVTVSQSQQFTSLSKEDVLDLLSKPGVVTTEEMLCDAILKWMETNEVDDDVSEGMIQLLKCESLSPDYICSTMMYHKQVILNRKLQAILTQEMRRRTRQNRTTLPSTPQSRSPKGASNDIIVAGHSNGTRRAFYCKAKTNAWIEMELPSMNTSDYFAAHKIDDMIFFTGGSTSDKTTHKFFISSKTLSRGPDLQEGRRAHGMTSVGDCIFVLAGYDSAKALSSIEKLKTDSDSWEKIGDLRVPQGCPGIAAVDDVIIVAGGWEQPDIIQTFNVTTQTAALLDTRLPSPMKRVRGVSLASGAAFVGEDGDLVQVSLSDHKVTVTSHVRLSGFGRRCFFGMVAKDDHLLCVGGGPDGQTSKTVDRYRFQGEREDRDRPPELPVALKIHGAFMARVMD